MPPRKPHPDPKEPKNLLDTSALEQRKALLGQPHMEPLNNFVRAISDQRGFVPYPDPLDGGIDARLLLLLETPGPQIFRTAFVSRDNPTGTAANLFRSLSEAGIPRQTTLIWNTVPWVLQVRGAPNRSPRVSEIREGLIYLPPLLALLPHLRAVVLSGRVARMARHTIEVTCPGLPTIEIPHPSPANVCTNPAIPVRIRDGLRQAGALLKIDGSTPCLP
jgi:uracil-DNA glycosylase